MRRLLLLTNIMIIGTIGYSQCTAPITNFPIYSDFETDTGGWIQDPADDFDWTRDSGGTASAGTGPINGTNAGADGSMWYMYTEASTPNNAGKIANLISPCFTLAPGTVSSVSFSYHMLGTVDLGTLQLDISTDDGATWTTLWSKLGSQGSSWLTDNVSLNAYEGLDVQIRYGVTTNTFRCDFAVDDISINSSAPVLEICNNNIDDDGDGLVDSEDPDCFDFCTVDCTTPYRFDWYDGSSGPQWPITNGETSLTRVYPIAGELGTYNVSVTLTNDDGQNIDLSNCGTAGNHFYTATCNDPNAAYDCDGDPAVVDGQFTYDCNFLTFGITSINSDESVSITYSFEIPSQICGLQIGDIDYQGSGAGNEGSWQDEIEIEASRNGVPVGINATVGAAVNAINNNTSNLILRSDFDTTSGGNINQNDAAGHAYITTLEKVTSITFKYSNGPEDDGLSDDHAIRINGFDFCPVVPDEICNNAIDDDGDGLVDQYDPDCPCTAAGIPNLDFNNDTNGNPLVAGTNASEIYAAWGIHISTTNVPSANYPPMIFDSYNPTGGDTDLGTPNSDFGGPGIGDGGKAGRIGENNANQGNVLIVSSNGAINDWSAGGTIIFDFDSDVDIASLEIIDFDYGNVDGNVRAFNAGNNLIEDRTIYACGDNCYQKINLSLTGVRRLEVNSTNSFSISSVNFCDDDLPVSSIGDFVWFDANQDGLSTGESGIEGIKVRLYDNASNLFAETITNSAGGYIFDNLAPGQYRVSIDPPSAYTATGDLDADNDNDSGVFTLASEQARTDVDFGLYVPCALSVSIDFNGSVCLGDDTQLTALPLEGTPGFTYSWTGPSSFTSTNQTVDVDLAGDYYVTVTDAYGCVSMTSVTVFDEPVVTLSADELICLGESVTIQATGGFDHIWSTGQSGSNIIVTPTVTTTYSVTAFTDEVNLVRDYFAFESDRFSYINTSASYGSASTLFDQVDNLSGTSFHATRILASADYGIGYTFPTSILISNVSLDQRNDCCADRARGGVVQVYDEGVLVYQGNILTGTGTGIISSTPNIDVIGDEVRYIFKDGVANEQGTHTLNFSEWIIEGRASCESTEDITISVAPDLSASVIYENSECLDSDTELTASPIGGIGPFTYSWTGPNSFTSDLATIAVPTNGNYYVTITDDAGCTAETSGFIYAAFEPFIFSLETSVCEGESVSLEINGSNISAYAWDSNAGNATTSAVTVTPVAPSSTYVVTVTNNNGCTSTATATIGAEALPLADAGPNVTVCEGVSQSFIGSDAGAGATYSWFFGADAIPVSATGRGPHIVSYNNPNTNGSNRSNTAVLTVQKDGCTNTDSKTITIYGQPDPTITFSSPSCGVDDGSITFSFVDNPNRTTIRFSIDGGSSYPYSVNDNTGSLTVNNLPSGDYPISTIWGNGQCPVELGMITLENNEIPTLTPSSADICLGSNSLVTSTTSGTWSSSDETVATVSSSGIVTGVGVGTAEINFTGANNCPSSNIVLITVVDLEGVTITGDNLLCEGETTTLTSSKNGGTWSSGNTSIATVNSSGAVTAVTAGVVLIHYIHPSNSCTEESNISIEVFATPVVSISGSVEVCVGETTTLSADGTGGFWTSSDNNIAIVSSTGIVSGIAAGTATFYYTSADGCPSDNTGTLTVTPAVSVSIDFNGSQCLTPESKLSAVISGGTSGYTFSWTGPGGFTGNTQTVDISLDGNYSVIVTDSKGCSDDATAFIYESYEPFIFALNTTVCEGESVTLSVSGASATGYQWSASAGNATTQSVTVIPSVPSTSYTVTVTNSIGCTTEATANIMVNAKPAVSVVGSTDICVGQTTQLAPSTGGTWTSANSSVASVSAAGVVTGVSNGSATFTFKSDATSCVSNATEPITVGANGSVAISGDSQICFGDNATLTASVTGGIWSSANTAVATIDPNGVVTPQGQGSTTITYDVGAGGCFDDGTYSITINADPAVSLNGSSTICEGDNTFVNASVSGSWTSSDEAVATISSTGVITGEGAGSATISFTSNAGCTKDLATPITVVGSPTVVRLGPADICINSTTALSPTSGGLWISSNNSIATVNSSGIVTGKGVGTAVFTFIESTNGCVSDETISITVSGPPSINGLSDGEICIGQNTTITPSTGGTWSSSNNGVATITNGGVITAISAGSARFTFMSDATGCISQLSAPLTVNPSPTVTFDGPTSICEQQTTNILPSSGGVWSSSDVSVATIQANGEITATGAGTVYFTWTSNATGCSSNPSGDLTVQEPTGISVSGPDAICIGAVTNLLPNSGGSWSSSNANIATISSNGEVVGVNPGIVTFTFSSATGCSSDPSTEITIHQNPSPVFTGPIDVCVGGTTQVGPATGGTWSSSDSGVATVDGNGNVTAISAGVATFTYKNDNTGCEETTVSSLNVYDRPVPTIVGDDMICIGFSTYLQPSSGGVWTSSNPSVAIISSSGQVTGITAGTATFTFYETGSTCVSDASDPITVAPKEPVSITGANTICINSTTSVQPSVGGSWISSNASVATVTDDGQVTGKSQGIARFTFVSDEGCSSNQTAPVIVYGPPSISIDGDNQLCAGGSLQMLPSTGGTWTSNNEGVATINNGGLVTAITAGTVRFTYTESATGCTSAASDLITINDSPETSVNGPDNICIGGVTNLTPTTGGIWTSINPDKATIQNNGQVTGVAVGEARFVFMQLNTGCISDTTAAITINGGPDIAFDGPTEICVGESTSITPNTGGTWQSTNPQIASINSAGEITGLAAGAVKFQYTETGTGCKSAFSETLVVNGLPTVSLAGSPFVCVGTTTHLSPSSGGSWISLTPGVASVTSTGIVTGVGEGEAFFQFVDAVTGCESDGSLSVSVQDAITAEVVGDTEICAGYTTSLSPSSGGVWTSSNIAVAKVSNFGTVTGVAPGVVTFTFTDSNSGCANTSTTDPITVSQCINHDFNVALVNQNITGDLSTNDLLPVGSTYSNIKITVQKPNASLSTLIIAPDGSYTFTTNKPGKYLYKVSACIPPASSGCPSAFLEINVVDDVYGTSNPISNLEFATTYTDNDVALPGQVITIQPMANDGCVYTGGCGLDATTVAVTDLPQNGTATAHADGTIVYTPDAGFVGHDTIYYEICVLGEAKCSQSIQVVTVNHTSAPNSVVASDDFTFTLKGTEVIGNLSTNDMDPEGDNMTVTQQGSLIAPIVTADGSYYINNDGTYGFTPNENFSGAMEIIYTICDDATTTACMSATLHIQVFDDLALQVRVYLEGALMQNGNQISIDGRPLMRDGLRLSGYDGERHIPVKDPYTYYTELFDLTPDMFTKMGPGLQITNMEVTDSISVFAVSGDNAIVDWVFVEIRDKNDARTVLATRSGLVQRDGDVVDLDGVSALRFQGINVDSFYIAVRHRTHLGVMSQKVRNGEMVDFTSPSTPTFNFGTSLGNGSDYTGLSQNSTVKSGSLALWAGDFNSDRVVKFTEPASDQNILYGNVLFTSPSFLINYDFTYGYYKGDYNMDGKAKYTNPDDDTNYLLAQIIFYRENTSFISNFAQMLEQIPNHE